MKPVWLCFMNSPIWLTNGGDPCTSPESTALRTIYSVSSFTRPAEVRLACLGLAKDGSFARMIHEAARSSE